MKQLKAIIYARVSTSSQDYDRQLHDLREYANRMGYSIVKEFSEKISGAKKVEEREAMMELLDYTSNHQIDKILIYECSRLSRRAIDFLQLVETFNERGISVFILQNGLETLLPTGEVNPIASLVLGILAQFNAMERNLIRSRMKSGYANYRANGGKVGRKEGYSKSVEDYRDEYAEEIRLYKRGYSYRNIQRMTGTAVTTLRKVMSLTGTIQSKTL